MLGPQTAGRPLLPRVAADHRFPGRRCRVDFGDARDVHEVRSVGELVEQQEAEVDRRVFGHPRAGLVPPDAEALVVADEAPRQPHLQLAAERQAIVRFPRDDGELLGGAPEEVGIEVDGARPRAVVRWPNIGGDDDAGERTGEQAGIRRQQFQQRPQVVAHPAVRDQHPRHHVVHRWLVELRAEKGQFRHRARRRVFRIGVEAAVQGVRIGAVRNVGHGVVDVALRRVAHVHLEDHLAAAAEIVGDGEPRRVEARLGEGRRRHFALGALGAEVPGVAFDFAVGVGRTRAVEGNGQRRNATYRIRDDPRDRAGVHEQVLVRHRDGIVVVPDGEAHGVGALLLEGVAHGAPARRGVAAEVPLVADDGAVRILGAGSVELDFERRRAALGRRGESRDGRLIRWRTAAAASAARREQQPRTTHENA